MSHVSSGKLIWFYSSSCVRGTWYDGSVAKVDDVVQTASFVLVILFIYFLYSSLCRQERGTSDENVKCEILFFIRLSSNADSLRNDNNKSRGVSKPNRQRQTTNRNGQRADDNSHCRNNGSTNNELAIFVRTIRIQSILHGSMVYTFCCCHCRTMPHPLFYSLTQLLFRIRIFFSRLFSILCSWQAQWIVIYINIYIFHDIVVLCVCAVHDLTLGIGIIVEHGKMECIATSQTMN